MESYFESVVEDHSKGHAMTAPSSRTTRSPSYRYTTLDGLHSDQPEFTVGPIGADEFEAVWARATDAVVQESVAITAADAGVSGDVAEAADLG